MVKGRRSSLGHLGHPVRVEKVGEVTGYGTVSRTQASLGLHRESKLPTCPILVTCGTSTTVQPVRPAASVQCPTDKALDESGLLHVYLNLVIPIRRGAR